MSDHDPYPPKPEEYPTQGGGYAPAPLLSPADQRTWSVVAHLSAFTLFVGLPVVGALIVYLIYRDRGAFVRHHSAQALNYQITWFLVFLVFITVGWIIVLAITFLTLGLVLVPIGLVALCLFVIPVIGAVKASNGQKWNVPLAFQFVS